MINIDIYLTGQLKNKKNISQFYNLGIPLMVRCLQFSKYITKQFSFTYKRLLEKNNEWNNVIQKMNKNGCKQFMANTFVNKFTFAYGPRLKN